MNHVKEKQKKRLWIYLTIAFIIIAVIAYKSICCEININKIEICLENLA